MVAWQQFLIRTKTQFEREAMEKEREKQVYLAKLNEQAQRFDEMAEAMKKVAVLDVELTIEERNLLSLGYKIVMYDRKRPWKTLSWIEKEEESKGNEQNAKRVKDYRTKVEDEVSEILNSPERACHLAKQALDEAMAELDSLSEDSYKDIIMILQHLSNNLTSWTCDLDEEDEHKHHNHIVFVSNGHNPQVKVP